MLAATGPSVAPILVGFVLAGVAIGCVETAEHAAVAGLAPEAAFLYAGARMVLALALPVGRGR